MKQPVEAHNQTQFSAEEPFFEQPVGVPQQIREVKPVVPFIKRRKTIILIIAAVTLVLLCILFIVNLIIEQNRRLGAGPEVTVATPIPQPVDSLVEQVEQLRAQWKAADPSQIELQPPAVDPSIRLDPPKR